MPYTTVRGAAGLEWSSRPGRYMEVSPPPHVTRQQFEIILSNIKSLKSFAQLAAFVYGPILVCGFLVSSCNCLFVHVHSQQH